ncbi:unnamed protein product [Linum tenue]|uniref:Uncharacterized protein n=1 Tax=Linum tenue TaxID=586396 RepID=A0AAV0Q890_9ROSI|nr:unnamed protein product [Linum tenue]
MASSRSVRKRRTDAAEAKSVEPRSGRKKIEKTTKTPNPKKEAPKKQGGDEEGPRRRSSRLQCTPNPPPSASLRKKPNIQVSFPDITPRSSNRKSSPILTPGMLGLAASKRVKEPEKVVHQQEPYYDAPAQLSQSDEEDSSSPSPGQRYRDIIDDIAASVRPQLFGAGIGSMRDETVVPGSGIFAPAPSLPAVYSEKMPVENGITLKNLLLGDGEPSNLMEGSRVNSTSALHVQSMEEENSHNGTGQVVVNAKEVSYAAEDSGQCLSFGLTQMEDMFADEVDRLDEVDCPAFVTVGRYRVKESCAPVLRTIIRKYGDIAANYTLKSPENRARALETVCECFPSFQTKKLNEVDPTNVGKALDVLNDLREAGLDIGWICERLEQIVKAKQVLKQASEMRQAKDKWSELYGEKQWHLKEIERDNELLKRKLEEKESEMEEEARQLEEQRRKVDEKGREKDELERQMMEGEEKFKSAKAGVQDAFREFQQVQERIRDAKTTVRSLAACYVMDGLL